MDVRRFIALYDKKTEFLVREIELNDVSLDEISKVFTKRDDDPLFYGCYEITNQDSNKVQNWFKEKIELSKYDYFLEASSK